MIFRILQLTAILTAAFLIGGCARTPSGGSVTAIREMTVHIQYGGAINDNSYYFFAIDTTGGGPGPVPVFPGLTAGESWVTGSITHYVQYHQRQYTVYRVTSMQPFQSEPLGTPVRSTLPTPGGQSLQFTIDLNTITLPSVASIDVNIIATDQPTAGVRFLDGLGAGGNDFFPLDIQVTHPVANSDSLTPETAGDVLDQNTNIQPQNDQTNPLDITDWTITLDV